MRSSYQKTARETEANKMLCFIYNTSRENESLESCGSGWKKR